MNEVSGLTEPIAKPHLATHGRLNKQDFVALDQEMAVKGFVQALEKAFAYTVAHPEDALATYLSAVPQADKKIETQAFKLTRPYFAVKLGHNLDKWQAFADFALEYGLIKNKVDATTLIHNWK